MAPLSALSSEGSHTPLTEEAAPPRFTLTASPSESSFPLSTIEQELMSSPASPLKARTQAKPSRRVALQRAMTVGNLASRPGSAGLGVGGVGVGPGRKESFESLFLIKRPVQLTQGRRVESAERRLLRAAKKSKDAGISVGASFLLGASRAEVQGGAPVLRDIWERDLPRLRAQFGSALSLQSKRRLANLRDKEGRPGIFFAAANNDLGLVRLLLSNGADP